MMMMSLLMWFSIHKIEIIQSEISFNTQRIAIIMKLAAFLLALTASAASSTQESVPKPDSSSLRGAKNLASLTSDENDAVNLTFDLSFGDCVKFCFYVAGSDDDLNRCIYDCYGLWNFRIITGKEIMGKWRCKVYFFWIWVPVWCVELRLKPLLYLMTQYVLLASFYLLHIILVKQNDTHFQHNRATSWPSRTSR